MKKPVSLIVGLLVMWGLAMVAVPEVPHDADLLPAQEASAD